MSPNEQTPSDTSQHAAKRVLVTGAGTGIGRGIALAFARHGATVALHYSHSVAGAKATMEEVIAVGGKGGLFAADFAIPSDVVRLAQEATAFLGGIDILVNNAGITMTVPFEDVTIEQFDILCSVNVRAPFFLTQQVLPALRESTSASVINISSIHAFEGRRDYSAYAATRGAIVSFTRQLAIELAPEGIRVNSIAPGSIEVENHYKAVPDLDIVQAGKSIPAGFVGQPADIGDVAVFLASEEARYVVGQTIIVDGGTTSWMPFSEDFLTASAGTHGHGYVPGL